MRGMKSMSWVVGLSLVGVALSTGPASAQVNHAATATNVSNSSAVRYGFEPVANNQTISPALVEAVRAIRTFTDTAEIATDGGEISADTRTALLTLAERLNEIEQGLWAYEGVLDESIRDAAAGLSQDLANADANCRADASACGTLNSLTEKINSFISNIETLRTNLIQSGQEGRIY